MPIYLDGAGLEKLDALPGKSRSQKVRDLVNAEHKAIRFKKWQALGEPFEVERRLAER